MGGVDWSFVHSAAGADQALIGSEDIKSRSDLLGFSRIWPTLSGKASWRYLALFTVSSVVVGLRNARFTLRIRTFVVLPWLSSGPSPQSNC
jgi:hypothetical protein